MQTTSSESVIPSAIKHLRNSDPVLAGVIDAVSEQFAMPPSRNKYRSLVEAIVTQQLSGHSARAISGRLKKMYNAPYPKPVDLLATPDSKLREAGLSIRKIECIKKISQMIEDKQIRLDKTANMSDEEIKDILIQVKGIGRWTVEIFLMFGLGRMNVLPVGDLGLRKGVKLFYGLPEMPTEDTVEKIAKAWEPYKSVATWYIWKAQ